MTTDQTTREFDFRQAQEGRPVRYFDEIAGRYVVGTVRAAWRDRFGCRIYTIESTEFDAQTLDLSPHRIEFLDETKG